MPLIDQPSLEKELGEIVQNETVQPQEDTLPEKYRGKSVADIARMHQEAEKLIGRQSSEVNELRRLADEHIKANLEALKHKEAAEEPDFFVDPKQAVRKIVESNPEIAALREKTAQLEAQSNRKALESKHPDFVEVLQTPEFQEWVMGSKYRKSLFQQANDTWDYEAADELFSTFKQLHKTEKPQAREEVKSAARKVAAVPSGNGGGADVSADSRKIYRRADLIRLQQTDPKRYEAMAPEIYAAYAEGRVR
jgi:hypothetical protein